MSDIDQDATTDLEAALSGEVTETTETTEATEAPEEATQAEPDVEVVEPAPEPEKATEPVMVPLAALQEVRDQVRDLKAQQQALQPAPEAPKAPDMFQDPEGFQKHQTQQFQEALQNERLNMSETIAVEKHGQELVDAMVQAVQKDPSLQAQWGQVVNSANPYGQMMQIYQQHQVAQEIGNDPEAYRARIIAEVKADIEADMAAKQVSEAAAKPAPSLATLTGTGGGPQTGYTGPTPLSNILGN